MVIFGFLFLVTRRRITEESSSPQIEEMRNVGCSSSQKRKWGGGGGGWFRERVSHFSLRSRAIGSLDFDGARRENVIRGAGYAWTPDLRVLTNSKR